MGVIQSCRSLRQEFFKVQQSTSTRSSPSPPPSPVHPNGQSTMKPRRRRSTALGPSRPAAIIDWSTSYMASASSSHSHGTLEHTGEDSSTFDESDTILSRPVPVSKPVNLRFTRSQSPIATRNTVQHPHVATVDATQSHTRTPSSMRHSSLQSHHHRIIINLLPKYYIFNPSIPRFGAQIDIRKLLEHLILFFAISLALVQFSRSAYVVNELWIIRGE